MSNEMMTMLIKLQADVGELKGGLAQAQSAIKGVDDNVKVADGGMKKMIGTLKNVAATMGVAFAGAQLASFAKDSIMAASSMAESLSKVRVVFDENAEAVIKWGSTAAENMGISNQAALEAAGTYGNLFQAFGLGQPEAQKMSTSLVQLAADMASFNNTSVDDAILALRSGLSGETEPLKRFGVALQDTRLKTEALKMGLINNTSEALTPAAKAQAAYNIIMRDTALAQGDYERTASGTANTMKTLQAKFADAKVAVGDALLPAFQAMLGVLKLAIPLLQKLGNFFKNNQDEIKAFAIVLGIAGTAWGVYTLAVKRAEIAQKLLNLAQKANPIGIIIFAVATLAAGLVKLYKNSESFRNAVNAMAKVALNAFASIVPMVGKVFEAIAKVVSGPLRAFLSVLSKLPGVGKYAKAGLDLINKGLDGISDLADGAAKKAKELADNLGKVNKEADKTAQGGKGAKRPKGEADPNEAKNKEKAQKAEEKRLKDLAAAQKKVQDIYKDMNEVIAEAEERAGEALARRDERIAEAKTTYAERVAELNETYNKAVAEADKDLREADAQARADNAKELARIAKDYADKKKDLEGKFQDKLADLRERAAQRTADIEEKYQNKIVDLRKKAEEKSADIIAKGIEKRQSLIQQSIDRLRNAFASGISLDLKEMFKDTNAAGLLTSLKDRLKKAQDLSAGAAELAGRGYSQTFIEQIVKAGPEAGLKMIDELKQASPEQQAEIQNNFKAIESIQDQGVNALAESMNKGANLATEELRKAYSQVTVDVQQALNEVNKDLQNSLIEAHAEYVKAKDDVAKELVKALADAQEEFDKAMAALTKDRDERIVEAAAKLEEQLAENKRRHDEALRRAKEALDEGLADAQKALQKALIDAQKDYEKAIDEINAATQKKLEALKAKLAEVAATIAALASAQASAAAMAAAPKYTPITAAGSSTTTTPKATVTNNNTTINQNVVSNADPYDMNMATLNALRYGQTVVVPSTLASKESGIIGAASIRSQTSATSSATSSRGGGGGGIYGMVME